MNGEPNTFDVAEERIRAGQTVRTSDGHKLGRVQSLTASYVMVTGGKIFWTKIYYVPLATIQSVNRSEILLSVPKTDPSVEEWLTPPLPVDAIADEVIDTDHAEESVATLADTAKNIDIPASSVAATLTTEAESESPEPENDAPEIRRPKQAQPAATPPEEHSEEALVLSPSERDETSVPSVAEDLSPDQDEPLAAEDLTPEIDAEEFAPEPELPVNSVSAAIPADNKTSAPEKASQTVPLLPIATPASHIPVNGDAVDKEIDQRIEELKRKLGISMRNAARDDANQPGGTPPRSVSRPPTPALNDRAMPAHPTPPPPRRQEPAQD